MNNFRLILKLNFDKVREMCISHNWFTKGTNDDFENFRLLIENSNEILDLDGEALNMIASVIEKFSDTEESVAEIRQALETIITISEREVI